jgi:hypothetical protein
MNKDKFKRIFFGKMNEYLRDRLYIINYKLSLCNLYLN